MRSCINMKILESENSETLRKIFVLNIFLILGFTLVLLMGGVALAQNALLLGIADFVMALFFLALFIYLHRTGNEPFVSLCGVGMLLIFFCYLFFIGGVHATAFMWLYTFPLFSLYLLGVRKGVRTTVLSFLLLCRVSCY